MTLVAGFGVVPNAKAVDSPSNYLEFDVIKTENIYAEQSISFEIVESEYMKSDDYKNMKSEESLPEILKQIRQCESHGNYQAQNSRSTASGAFQFLDSTWANYAGYSRAKDAPKYIQDQKALETYNLRGTTPWASSRGCWGNSGDLTVNIILKERSPNATNCVRYLESIGIDVPNGYGLAKNIPVSTKTPHVGAIMVSYESGAGHVSVVREIRNDTLVIEDGNYFSGYRTIRIINRNSSLIKGFV